MLNSRIYLENFEKYILRIKAVNARGGKLTLQEILDVLCEKLPRVISKHLSNISTWDELINVTADIEEKQHIRNKNSDE